MHLYVTLIGLLIGWGIRFERLSVEFERIERYSALGHLANADEVVEYQKWKESLLNQ